MYGYINMKPYNTLTVEAIDCPTKSLNALGGAFYEDQLPEHTTSI